MKTYQLLEPGHMKEDPKMVFDTTESLTNFLLELRYTEDEITQLLANPTTRACVEINYRSYAIKNKSGKKYYIKYYNHFFNFYEKHRNIKIFRDYWKLYFHFFI